MTLASSTPRVNSVGLVAHYKLQHGPMSSGKVFDYSLNNNQGTVTGAYALYPGFYFDATDDIINCSSGSTVDNIFTGGGTVAWWQRSDGRGESNLGFAIGKTKWSVYMITDASTMRFYQAFDGDDGAWSFAITSGVWQHVAVVYNNGATTNNPVVYVNGASVTATETGTPTGTFDSDAAADLVIGNTAATTNTWEGAIGEVMVFSITKTASEIKSIYELTRHQYQI